MNKKQESITNHLKELRKRLIYSVLFVLFFSAISFAFWKQIWYLLSFPLKKISLEILLINTSPTEAVLISFKLALACGFIAASPFIIYQLWKFISPGLKKREKNSFFFVLTLSTFFTTLSLWFSHQYILPYSLDYLARYTLSDITPSWTQMEYLHFIIKIFVAFLISFQLPIVVLFLSYLDLVKARDLWSFFRYALLIIFIFSALLTPPDPNTQFLLAIPLCLVYVFSILVAYLTTKIRNKKK